jgi:hypothetical protein
LQGTSDDTSNKNDICTALTESSLPSPAPADSILLAVPAADSLIALISIVLPLLLLAAACGDCACVAGQTVALHAWRDICCALA